MPCRARIAQRVRIKAAYVSHSFNRDSSSRRGTASIRLAARRAIDPYDTPPRLGELPLPHLSPDAVNFGADLVALVRQRMTLRRGRPEVRRCKPRVQVRAEVVHPSDREHDVDSELWVVSREG